MQNIEIPEIEICAGWYCEDLKTEDDCDDAFAYLTCAIVSIEMKLDDLVEKGMRNTPSYSKTNGALRWKKAALSVVQRVRGRISRANALAVNMKLNERLLTCIKAHYPNEFDKSLEAVTRAINAESIGVPSMAIEETTWRIKYLKRNASAALRLGLRDW